MNLKKMLATASLVTATFGFSAVATAQTAGTAAVGTVTTSQGQVLLVRNGLTYSAPLNTPVLAGDRFLTGDDSRLRVRMNDGCDRVLPEMSRARIVGCDAAFDPATASRGDIANALRNAASYPAGVTPPAGVASNSAVSGPLFGSPSTASVIGLAAGLAVVAGVAVAESDSDELERPVPAPVSP